MELTIAVLNIFYSICSIPLIVVGDDQMDLEVRLGDLFDNVSAYVNGVDRSSQY